MFHCAHQYSRATIYLHHDKCQTIFDANIMVNSFIVERSHSHIKCWRHSYEWVWPFWKGFWGGHFWRRWYLGGEESWIQLKIPFLIFHLSRPLVNVHVIWNLGYALWHSSYFRWLNPHWWRIKGLIAIRNEFTRWQLPSTTLIRSWWLKHSNSNFHRVEFLHSFKVKWSTCKTKSQRLSSGDGLTCFFQEINEILAMFH